MARDRAVVIKDPHFKDQWYLVSILNELVEALFLGGRGGGANSLLIFKPGKTIKTLVCRMFGGRS